MSASETQVLVLGLVAVIGIAVAVWAAIRRRRQIVITVTAAGFAIVSIMILAAMNATVANSITLLATLAAAAIAVASLWQTRDLEERRAREAMLDRILDWVNEALRVKATFSVFIDGKWGGLWSEEGTSKDWEARREADRRLLLAKKPAVLKEVERLCRELPAALPLKTAIEKVVSMFEHEDFRAFKFDQQIDEQCTDIVMGISVLRAVEGL
jgi:hypothetical protein